MSNENLPPIHTLWNYNAPAETAVTFRELLAQVEVVDATEYYLELQTQLARTESLQGNFDAAHAILDEVEPKLASDFPLAQMRYLLERGRSFNSAGEPETAVPLFKEAYDIGLATGASEDLTIDAAHMLGIAMPTTAVQLEWNLLALDLAEKATTARGKRWKGSLYNNIGWTYNDMGEYEKALDIFERTLAYYQDEQPEQTQYIRIARWSIAKILRLLKHPDEALTMQHALEAEYAAEGGDQDGFVFEELAECYLLKGEETTAKSYFVKAYDLLAQVDWLVRADPERLERMAALAK